MFSKTQLRRIAVTMVALLLSGCYTYKAFSPSELPKLNKTYTTGIGVVTTGHGVTPLYNMSYTQLRTPNGRLLGVEGRPEDVRLKLASGKVLYVKTPYQFEINGDTLNIQCANHPPMSLPFENVIRAELPEKNYAAMVFWYVLAIGVVLGVTALAISMDNP